LILPDLRLIRAINHAVRYDDEWFDDTDDERTRRDGAAALSRGGSSSNRNAVCVEGRRFRRE